MFLRPLLATGCLLTTLAAAPPSAVVFLGGYSSPAQPGIQLARFDDATGTLSDLEPAAEIRSPSFLALHPSGKTLYAVTETADFEGHPGGGLTAFRIDPTTHRLHRLNTESTRGGGPCHVTIDPAGHFALIANYGGGSIASFPLRADGSLGPAASFHQHHGSGSHPDRQRGPHAHGIYVDQTGRFALVPDLGLDQVLIYRFDDQTGILTPADPPFVALPPGSGPRHLTFDPDQTRVYVINELSSTVTAMDWDAATGQLVPRQAISTLPPDFSGNNTTAEIGVSADGRFLYASNRGQDSIAIFAIERADGRLRRIGEHPTGGRTPRHFALSPSGLWLVAANQNSGNLVTLRVHPDTGLLSHPRPAVAMPAPSCILFAGRLQL